MKTNIIIISGPSGSGKDSIISGLQNHFPIERVITTTTRAPRPGESQGNPYHFSSVEKFEQMMAAGELIEWAKEDNGQYYGIPASELDRVRRSGKVGILRIGYQGVMTVKRLFPEIMAILINADLPILEKRIRQRDHGQAEDYIQKRMDHTSEFLKHRNLYDFEVINEEGRLDEAIAKTARIIQNTLNEPESD